MRKELNELTQRLEGVEVPETYRFSTGPEETVEIGRITDDYFDRTITALRLSNRALQSFFEIQHRTLGEEEPGGLLRVSDDFDTSLWLKGVQPLASVRNVRDDPNFQVILFAKYPLLNTAEIALQSIIELETNI